MHSALDIAAWFLNEVDRKAGDSITNLKLQKLVYYAQAWALAILDRPLFEEDFRAWAHGPVSLDVWHAFKDFGWNALPAPRDVPEFDEEVEELLKDVLSSYGEHSAKKLEELTHSEEPWLLARGDLAPEERSMEIIPKSHMKKYYRKRYEQVGQEEE